MNPRTLGSVFVAPARLQSRFVASLWEFGLEALPRWKACLVKLARFGFAVIDQLMERLDTSLDQAVAGCMLKDLVLERVTKGKEGEA